MTTSTLYHYFKYCIGFCLLILVSSSCERPEYHLKMPMGTLKVEVRLPEGYTSDFDSLHIVLTSINNRYNVINLDPQLIDVEQSASDQTAVDVQYRLSSQVIKGAYSAKITTAAQSIEGDREELSAMIPNVIVTDQDNNSGTPTITLTPNTQQYGLVIKEIFAAGSAKPNGRPYLPDKYFILYNNSNDTILMDSVAICESAFITNRVLDKLDPDHRNDMIAVGTVYMIPKEGKRLAPGEQMILADVASDHTQVDPNYIDLSHADYEWYDDHPMDTDTPDVPNLVKYFSYSRAIWTPHMQGVRGYVLVRMHEDTDTFIATRKYDYSYETTLKGKIYHKTIRNKAVVLPKDWVIDAVEMSMKDDLKWNVFPLKMDKGYTWFKETVKSPVGTAVRRKVLRQDGDRIIYMDTNNSTVDFIPNTKPSLSK